MGFIIMLPDTDDPQLDLETALRVYMKCTTMVQALVPRHPVFVSLTQPYHALTADTISHILAGTIPATKVYTCCNVRREAAVTDDSGSCAGCS